MINLYVFDNVGPGGVFVLVDLVIDLAHDLSSMLHHEISYVNTVT